MSFVTNLVLLKLKDHLTEKLITDIALDDPVRADVVKIGRFQDNPIRNNFYVAISGGDVEDPKIMDGIVTLDQFENIGMKFMQREIGQGQNQFWWRRGVIKFGCYMIQDRLSEEAAAERAYEFLGRLLASVDTCDIMGLVDSNGERPQEIYAYANTMSESGGPPNQYIWRGSVLFQFLTERFLGY